MGTVDAAQPDWLAQLAPAHMPPPVGWWPPAPGWWMLAVILMIVIGVLVSDLALMALDPRIRLQGGVAR